MKASASEHRISLRFLTFAPLVALAMPFVGTLFDRDSKCRLIPLLEFEGFAVQILIVIYFALPLLAGFYGLKLFFDNRKSSRKNESGFLIVLTALNLLSPTLLYGWLFAALIILLMVGCYDIKIKM